MALSDVSILDVTIARSGPVAVRQFSDWGASVIRVDSPIAHNMFQPMESGYMNLHRNKRAITLDLKQQRGRDIFYELVERADILVENFRPGVKFALGIDYETLAAMNPRLIYGSISGFGQSGPYGEKGGVDQIIQGMSGLMSITGTPESGPMRAGVAISDMVAGQYLAFGLLAALYERQRSGKGQWVNVSLLEAMIATLDFQAARWTVDGEVPHQAGNDHPTKAPMSLFQTSNGYVNLAASSDRLWQRLCDVLDDSSLASDPRYATDPLRSKNRVALNERIASLIITRATREWCDIFDAAGIPAGPLYEIDEMFADPQVEHLNMTTEVEHSVRGKVALIRQPVGMSRTPAKITRASPMPGQDRDEILQELGYTSTQIVELAELGVV
jgi:formyl-CoA transferase